MKLNRARIKNLFKTHPKQDSFVITTDGEAFFKQHDATNYSNGQKFKEAPETITREQAEAWDNKSEEKEQPSSEEPVADPIEEVVVPVRKTLDVSEEANNQGDPGDEQPDSSSKKNKNKR